MNKPDDIGDFSKAIEEKLIDKWRNGQGFYANEASRVRSIIDHRMRKEGWVKPTENDDRDEKIEKLEFALVEIAKRGANPITQYGYGTIKPWVRLADDVWEIARNALEGE